MPVNKFAFNRYILIDRCLTRKDKPFHTAEDIIQYISNNLDLPEPISLRTLQSDLKEMRESNILGYYAPIVFDRTYKGYHYSDANFSIGGNFNLSQKDLEVLEYASNILDVYRNISLFSNFRDAVDKIVTGIKIKKLEPVEAEHKKIIQPMKPAFVGGTDWLDILVNYIKNKKVIEVKYKKFTDSEIKKHILHPFLLREYNNRWYLMAISGNTNNVLTFGLDRIVNVQVMDNIKYITHEFDSEEYFKNVIGMTALQNVKIETITLSFSPLMGQYLKSKHLHHSQKIIEENKNETIIEFEIIPTIEFQQFIFSCGTECKVVSPNWYKKQILSEINKMVEQYK